MPTTTPTVWADADYQLAPGDYADLYTRASALIGQLGYNPQGENYEGERGISIETALNTATDELAGRIARPLDVAEEALTRLVGVAYLLGIIKHRTNIGDLTDLIAAWELCHTHYVGVKPSQDAARELLAVAARTLRAMA